MTLKISYGAYLCKLTYSLFQRLRMSAPEPRITREPLPMLYAWPRLSVRRGIADQHERNADA